MFYLFIAYTVFHVSQNANPVFSGVLRNSKQQGSDVSWPRSSTEPGDLEKLYEQYFIPGLATQNIQVLLHKVFFDFIFYLRRRAKEGFREIQKELVWHKSYSGRTGMHQTQCLLRHKEEPRRSLLNEDECSSQWSNPLRLPSQGLIVALSIHSSTIASC